MSRDASRRAVAELRLEPGYPPGARPPRLGRALGSIGWGLGPRLGGALLAGALLGWLVTGCAPDPECTVRADAEGRAVLVCDGREALLGAAAGPEGADPEGRWAPLPFPPDPDGALTAVEAASPTEDGAAGEGPRAEGEGAAGQGAVWVLASAQDVAVFNATAPSDLPGAVHLAGALPTEVTLPHLRRVGALVVDRPLGLRRLLLPALQTADRVQITGELAALAASALREARTLDLRAADALTPLVLPALTTLDGLHLTHVAGGALTAPALRHLGALTWTGGRPGAAAHTVSAPALVAVSGAVTLQLTGPGVFEAPRLAVVGGLVAQGPAGSGLAVPALDQVAGDLVWGLVGVPAPPRLAGIRGDALWLAGATVWPALATVGGSLLIEGPGVLGLWLPRLAAVGQHLWVRRAGLDALVWPALASVGAALPPAAPSAVRVDSCPDLQALRWPALAQAHRDEAGVAVRVVNTPALCGAALDLGAFPRAAVRQATPCAR